MKIVIREKGFSSGVIWDTYCVIAFGYYNYIRVQITDSTEQEHIILAPPTTARINL